MYHVPKTDTLFYIPVSKYIGCITDGLGRVSSVNCIYLLIDTHNFGLNFRYNAPIKDGTAQYSIIFQSLAKLGTEAGR